MRTSFNLSEVSSHITFTGDRASLDFFNASARDVDLSLSGKLDFQDTSEPRNHDCRRDANFRSNDAIHRLRWKNRDWSSHNSARACGSRDRVSRSTFSTRVGNRFERTPKLSILPRFESEWNNPKISALFFEHKCGGKNIVARGACAASSATRDDSPQKTNEAAIIVGAFDSFAPAHSASGLPVYVARRPPAPFCLPRRSAAKAGETLDATVSPLPASVKASLRDRA